MSQAILNALSIQIFNPDEEITVTTLIPIVPLYIVLLAPICEEIIFRYIIFGWLQRNKEKFSILAASISSALFAIAHLNIVYAMGYFVVGFMLCYVYYKHKNIKITIISHMFLNYFALFSQSIHIVFGG